MLTLATVVLALAAQEPTDAGAPPDMVATLTERSFGAWRDHIRVDPSERAWARLPWLATFHDGLRRAAAERKPLLLWAMNGHPLGCT